MIKKSDFVGYTPVFLCLNKDQFQPQIQLILIEFEGQSQLVVNYAIEQELSSVIKQNISV